MTKARFLVVESNDILVGILEESAKSDRKILMPLGELASRAGKDISELTTRMKETRDMSPGKPEKTRYYVVEPLNGASELRQCGVNPMKYHTDYTQSGRFKGMEGMK